MYADNTKSTLGGENAYQLLDDLRNESQDNHDRWYHCITGCPCIAILPQFLAKKLNCTWSNSHEYESAMSRPPANVNDDTKRNS